MWIMGMIEAKDGLKKVLIICHNIKKLLTTDQYWQEQNNSSRQAPGPYRSGIRFVGIHEISSSCRCILTRWRYHYMVLSSGVPKLLHEKPGSGVEKRIFLLQRSALGTCIPLAIALMHPDLSQLPPNSSMFQISQLVLGLLRRYAS
jgi:hypothetical protein